MNTKLSPREAEIISYVSQGYTAKEVARAMRLEPRTIEIYMANVRKKLGAKNVAHAVYLVCNPQP